MTYGPILVEISDRIATVTLNRPERLNAFTREMGAGIGEAFADLDQNDDVRVIVVTGAGRAFCAGQDLSGGGGTFDRRHRPREEPRRFVRPWNLHKPIIAAINGAAIGVGITLPMQWDIRVAAESARIGFVFVRRGITPEAVATWTVVRQLGLAKANELLLTGRILTAKEALEFGLVTHVWPDAEFRDKVRAMALDIADNTGPVSVALTKRLTWSMLGETEIEKAQAADTRAFVWSGQQPDAYEGIRAFLEKRKPAWKMSASKDFPDFMPPIG
jgi:enoyl-CoA hydratase/carnithine racemase